MTGAEAIRLRLLGDPAVEGPGEDAAGIQSQPKRLALLAYLAVQGGFVRRDVLAEMFWPDSDAERPRRALSQATHILRRSLGRSVIRSRGTEELGISPDHVWIDVRSFEAAIAGERWAEAVELHRDELLHGLNGDQVSPEFSRWLDGERLRLQRAAAGAAKKLADAAFREGDIAGAIAWARRAVAVRPLDEAMFREYIALLDEAGDAAQALSEYESFRSRLSTEYDLEPARETVRLIEMIRSRRPEAGPAVRAPDLEINAFAELPAASSVPMVSRPAAGPQGAPPTSRFPRPLRLGLALVPLFLVAWLAWDLVLTAPPGAADSVAVPNRIAVLYLEPVGDHGSDVAHIASNLTHAVTNYLHSYSSLSVVPLTAVAEFRNRTVPHDSLKAVLRASMFMFGQVEMNRDSSVLVNVELTDDDRVLIWRGGFRFDSPNLLLIEDSVISAITAQAARIGAHIERRALRRGTEDELAYANVSRSISLADQYRSEIAAGRLDVARSMLAAIDSLLDQAIDADRSWAKPYIELAGMHSKVGFLCPLTRDCESQQVFSEGVAFADRAVQLARDSITVADAYEARAQLNWQLWVYGSGGDSDTTYLSRAGEDAHRAIAARAQSPSAYSLLSLIYAENGEYENSLTAALDALGQDEFLTRESQILDRVFNAAFNTYDDTLAAQFCARLVRSEPVSLRSVECRLQLAAWTDEQEADVDAAWALLSEFRDRSPRQYKSVADQTELLVASVIGAAREIRSELADSALSVVERVLEGRRTPTDDVLMYAAQVYALLGDQLKANELLGRYLAGGERARMHVANKRWFRQSRATELNDNVGTGR